MSRRSGEAAAAAALQAVATSRRRYVTLSEGEVLHLRHGQSWITVEVEGDALAIRTRRMAVDPEREP